MMAFESQGADTVTVTPWAETAVSVNGGDPSDGDLAIVNATATSDTITIQATGVTINAFPTVMLTGIERIDVNSLADNDVVTVTDMTGSNVSQVNVSLGAGTDTVEVQGTPNNDLVSFDEAAGLVTVNGLASVVTIAGAGAGELVRFAGGSGEDQLTASGATPGVNVGAGRITGSLTANLDFTATEALLIHAGTSLSVSNATTYVHTPGPSAMKELWKLIHWRCATPDWVSVML